MNKIPEGTHKLIDLLDFMNEHQVEPVELKWVRGKLHIGFVKSTVKPSKRVGSGQCRWCGSDEFHPSATNKSVLFCDACNSQKF